MKTILKKWGMTFASALMGLAVAVTVARCGSGSSNGGAAAFQQVEQLARPGINELFILTPAFLTGYNAGAPGFVGFPADTVGAVVGEAKTVFKALFHSVCLINGLLGLTAGSGGTGLKPAGVACGRVGDAGATNPNNFFTDGNALTGATINAAQATAAQTYADRVASAFLLDVMRIDVSGPDGYGAQFCSTAGTVAGILADNTATDDATSGKPLLCGGRKLADDVIDISYNYLLGGAAGTQGNNQVTALLSDGVHYTISGAPVGGDNPTSISIAVANPAQGHEAPSNTFPYVPKAY